MVNKQNNLVFFSFIHSDLCQFYFCYLYDFVLNDSKFLQIVINNEMITTFICRALSTTSCLAKDDSWLSKLLVRKIEPTKESHSRMLSDKEVIYALHTHNVRADSKQKYLEN